MTLSRVEIFENGDVSYSSGWAKTEVFKYDDVMPRLALLHSYGAKLCFSSATYDSKIQLVDADFVKYAEKTSPFSKIPGYKWTVKYNSKTLRKDADFFEYGAKKFPATCGRGPKLGTCYSRKFYSEVMIANTYPKLFRLSSIWHWVSFKFILQSCGQASKRWWTRWRKLMKIREISHICFF